MKQKNTISPSKTQAKIESFIESLLNDNEDLLKERFLELPAKDMFNVLAKLLPYIVPKQKAAKEMNNKTADEAPIEQDWTEDNTVEETTDTEDVFHEVTKKETQNETDEPADSNTQSPTPSHTDNILSPDEITDLDETNKIRRPNKGCGKSSKNRKSKKRR